MTAILYDNLMVCDECALVIANGEIDDGTDRGQQIADAQVEQWGELAIGLTLACGDDEDECDYFSWRRCDGCGSTLGGGRHKAVVFA